MYGTGDDVVGLKLYTSVFVIFYVMLKYLRCTLIEWERPSLIILV